MSSESASPAVSSALAPRIVGRYSMYDEIASGGMASIHLGRLLGEVGFSRTVAIKYLHPHFSNDAEFVSMFLDEARLAARIQHPNVATPLDVVVESDGEIFLVMEYVHGETLLRMIADARSSGLVIPLSVSASIMSGALHGLHAAHEAVDEAGEPLGVVHRDVSPQNIIVGTDGVARVLDFGVAKAVSRCQSTRQGHLKGKLPYMAPEQMRSGPVDRRVDVFSAGIVLWEALTQRRLFKPDDPASAFAMILSAVIGQPSTLNHDIPPALDEVVMKALDRNLETRFQTALEFADALEEAVPLASHRKVGEWVQRLCGKHLAERASRVSDIERASSGSDSAKDAERFLRSRRGSVPVDSLDPTGSTTDQPAAGRARTRTYQSALSRADIPPSPSPDQPLVVVAHGRHRSVWVIAAASLVVVLLGAAGLYRLRMTESPTRGGPLSDHPVPNVPSAAAHAGQVVIPSPPAAEPSPGAVASDRTIETELPAAAEPTPAEKAKPTPAGKIERRRGAPKVARQVGKAKSVPTRVSKIKRSRERKDCDPPYYVDYQGIRRVKPNCL